MSRLIFWLHQSVVHHGKGTPNRSPRLTGSCAGFDAWAVFSDEAKNCIQGTRICIIEWPGGPAGLASGSVAASVPRQIPARMSQQRATEKLKAVLFNSR